MGHDGRDRGKDVGRHIVSFDWALKKLLRSKANFVILEGLLSVLLREDIRIVEVLESESNKDHVDDRFNRVDLKVRNSAGAIVLIELQYERDRFYFQRMLYATSKTVAEHMEEGMPYRDVVKVISVNILHFDAGQGTDCVYHGTTGFVGMRHGDELQLTPAQMQRYGCDRLHQLFPEMYLLKLNKFDDVARDKLDQWMYFLKHEEIPEGFDAPGLKEAGERLAKAKLSREEREAYDAWIDSGRRIESVLETSRLEGYEAGREDVARRMLDRMDDGEIAEITGLSLQEVAALRRSSKNR